MYTRISNALIARANRISSSCISTISLSLSPTETATETTGAAAPYILDCGTLSTSTWPLTSVTIIVTATSVVLQCPPSASPPRSASYAVLGATLTHPRRPLRMTMQRSPMWYAAATRSQRSYTLSRSTLNFTTKYSASAAERSFNDSGDTGASPDAPVQAAENSIDDASNDDEGELPISEAVESSATGSVMLPDAMVLSFKGNPNEFHELLHRANVLVFFYKAVCVPCVAIRSKLIHAVTDHLPIDASHLIQGVHIKKTAASTPDQGGGGGGQRQGINRSGTTSGTPAQFHGENQRKHYMASSTTEAAMATEDKAACELACRTLEDVSRVYPDRMILLTVDTNENAKLTALHDIRSLPTFFGYRDGCVIGRVEGADVGEVRRLVHAIMNGKDGEELVGNPATGTAVGTKRGTQYSSS
ncbi:hypothetical protein ABL78_0119 [Leptomonas seymouri]|uniref:Thioredoxin domain-containing protein n=1 Tax=Leptomonas seymouri TaxID=5684 RepID=A0A0N1PFL6_LEPSE|nr:hypothetical protein ABL78_0119 [Leptomonas seymouri]|eukprot:KPI90683.1 hypothetical protein ABL78_0119 [Leptomonas seymouri]